MIRTELLNVWFELPTGDRVHAVRDVSLTLSASDRLAVVGESGSGKTTLLLALMGLLPDTAIVGGMVEFNGQDLVVRGEDGFRPYRWSDIALVFQGAMSSLNPVKSVGKQIAEPIEMHRKATRRGAKRRAVELMEEVGLSAAAFDWYPHELSGGMRQRACIAMALACDPGVLLADEPTTALDVIVQAEILRLLDGLTRSRGIALVLVTHDLPVAAQICERLMVMYDGRVVERGMLSTIIASPAHPYTELLIEGTRGLFGGVPAKTFHSSRGGNSSQVGDGGCAFQDRCRYAFDRCRTTRPSLQDAETGSVAACHLLDHLASLHS
jgi:oligopeptide/dipeptide ABC transporter ATP-binding protein